MPKEVHHEHLYSRLPDLYSNRRAGLRAMGEQVKDIPAHSQMSGAAVQDGNKDKKKATGGAVT